MPMRSMKKKAGVLAALALLLAILFVVWYVLFGLPDPGKWPEGTLVWIPLGELVSM